MKDDAPLPASIPRKRRQVETALDRHIAIWLADLATAPGDRKRLEAEKARRKSLAATLPATVGLIVPDEGVTPEQLGALPEMLNGATKVFHHFVPGKVHHACKQIADVVALDGGRREVVRQADRVVVIVPNAKDMTQTEVWNEGVRYARHRNVPVAAVLPDGTLYEGDRDG